MCIHCYEMDMIYINSPPMKITNFDEFFWKKNEKLINTFMISTREKNAKCLFSIITIRINKMKRKNKMKITTQSICM